MNQQKTNYLMQAAKLQIVPPVPINFQERINKLKFKVQIEEFNKNLQKGDLGLSQLIQNGYILYGDTRAGKTTLGHLLSGGSLKGIKMNGDFMAQASTSKNRNAKIGNTMRSETLVPNKFLVRLKGKTQSYSLIDTPGYGDTNGMLTILANGYYHYRLYSKVKSMKFIVCFDANQLQNTCVDFIKTIVNWSSSFKDYLLDRKKIWRSLAFVITKVQDKPTIKEDLIAKLRNIQQKISTLYEKNVEDALKELIDFIIKEDRLFYVKKIIEGETLVAGDLLDRIDAKITDWWTRDLIEVKKQGVKDKSQARKQGGNKNETPQKQVSKETDPLKAQQSKDDDRSKRQVSMEKISFPLSEQIIKSTTEFPICRQQFIELIEYYNLRIKEFKNIQVADANGKHCSLAFVIQELLNDAMGHPDNEKNPPNNEKNPPDNEKNPNNINGHPDSHRFIHLMKHYIDLYYNNYDQSYKEERQKREKELFSLGDDSLTSQRRGENPFKGKDKNYLVKKFRCLEEIDKLKNLINDANLNQQLWGKISIIDECAASVYKIIKEFNKVAFKRSFASEVIYKYGYIIHRIIEEAKIFILLIQIYGAKDKLKVMQQANGENIALFRELKDFMGIPLKYKKKQMTYQDLHLAFINQFNIEDQRYKSLIINQDIVEFFSHVTILNPSDADKHVQIVLKYSDTVLEEAQSSSKFVLDKHKGQLIKKIARIRVESETAIFSKKGDEQQKCLFTIRKASQNLGKLFELLGQYQLSRNVYKTIRFVDSVCKLYHFQINQLKKPGIKNEPTTQKELTRQKEFSLRIQFSEFLAKHFRQNEAIQVLQESYELASNKKDLMKVKTLLCDLKAKMKDLNAAIEYEKNLFNQEFFDSFPEELTNDIEAYAKSAI